MDQNQPPSQSEHSRRKHHRHLLRNVVKVIDLSSGNNVGVVVNLSEEGIMLVNNTALRPDCIYQLQLDIAAGVIGEEAAVINMGIDCLWTSPAESMASMYWSGCQIIDISDDSHARMQALIAAVGD